MSPYSSLFLSILLRILTPPSLKVSWPMTPPCEKNISLLHTLRGENIAEQVAGTCIRVACERLRKCVRKCLLPKITDVLLGMPPNNEHGISTFQWPAPFFQQTWKWPTQTWRQLSKSSSKEPLALHLHASCNCWLVMSQLVIGHPSKMSI